MVKVEMAAQEESSSSKGESFFNIDSDYKITTKLTTFPLNGRNYSTWVTNATRALLGMRVLGFVDGKVKQPKVGDKEYEEWRYVDNLVITWIINSIDQSLVGAFNKAKTAKDLWNALARRFGNQGNLLKVYELKEIITNAKMNGHDFLSYSNKIKEAWDELECLRPITTNEEELEKRANEDLVCSLLAGLGPSFGDLRNQILRSKETPSYDDVVNMVDRELMAREAFDREVPLEEKPLPCCLFLVLSYQGQQTLNLNPFFCGLMHCDPRHYSVNYPSEPWQEKYQEFFDGVDNLNHSNISPKPCHARWIPRGE